MTANDIVLPPCSLHKVQCTLTHVAVAYTSVDIFSNGKVVFSKIIHYAIFTLLWFLAQVVPKSWGWFRFWAGGDTASQWWYRYRDRTTLCNVWFILAMVRCSVYNYCHPYWRKAYMGAKSPKSSTSDMPRCPWSSFNMTVCWFVMRLQQEEQGPFFLQIDAFGKWRRCLPSVCYVKLKKHKRR